MQHRSLTIWQRSNVRRMKANESSSHRSLLGTWSAMMKDSSINIRVKSISIFDMQTSHINITITLNLCRIVVLKGLHYIVDSRSIFFSGT